MHPAVIPRGRAKGRSILHRGNMMKLLYITFIDFGERSSGSGVRPHRMYEAFKAEGCDITLLECRQNRRRLRRQRVREVLGALSSGYLPEACYIEPPSGPFFNRIDLRLLKRLHRLGVPIGLFYRDAYWRFADWWGVTGLKRRMLVHMHRRDIRVFRRCCDMIYFPSESMRLLFHKDFGKSALLPPGCVEPHPTHDRLFGRAIYVGNVSDHYGTHLLLEAFERLNADGAFRPLRLVCRQREWEAFDSPLKTRPWLETLHASGDDALAPLYAESDVGILSLKRDIYMDFAMPVKLFEYLGYGLPVIATHCNEVAGFVRRYNCGLVCKDNAMDLAQSVERFYQSPREQEDLRAGAANAARDNLWTMRAKTVLRDLSQIKTEAAKGCPKGERSCGSVF